MGDMAEQSIEEGLTAYAEHKGGLCGQDGPCQYCDAEEAQRTKWRDQKRRQRQAAKQRTCRHPRRVTPEGRYTWWRCVDCQATGRVTRTRRKHV